MRYYCIMTLKNRRQSPDSKDFPAGSFSKLCSAGLYAGRLLRETTRNRSASKSWLSQAGFKAPDFRSSGDVRYFTTS